MKGLGAVESLSSKWSTTESVKCILAQKHWSNATQTKIHLDHSATRPTQSRCSSTSHYSKATDNTTRSPLSNFQLLITYIWNQAHIHHDLKNFHRQFQTAFKPRLTTISSVQHKHLVAFTLLQCYAEQFTIMYLDTQRALHYMTHYMWHCTQRAHYTAVCGTAAKGEVEDYIPVHNKQGGPSPVVSTTKVWHAKSQQDSVLGIVVPMLCAWSSSCGGGLHIHSPNSISWPGLPLPRRAACVPASYMLLQLQSPCPWMVSKTFLQLSQNQQQ